MKPDKNQESEGGQEAERKKADPLASQDLGMILHAVTTNMLEDVDGWARMFRVKIIEAG